MYNLVLATFAALAFPLALPNEFVPFGNPLLGLIAIAPLFVALYRTRTHQQAAGIGALFGAVSTFAANYWLMFYGEFSVWTIGGTTAAYAVFGAMLGPTLQRFTRAPAAYRPFLLAVAWTGYEYLKSVGFLGYPWSLAAYPFNTISVLTQLVDVTGVWGLSFLAALANAIVTELVIFVRHPACRPRRGGVFKPATVRAAAMLGVLMTLTVGYGTIRLSRPIPIIDSLDVVLVQQNADSWNVADVQGPIRIAQEQTALGVSARSGPPDLIVWSETSLRYTYNASRSWYQRFPEEQPFLDFLADLPAPLLTGSPLRIDGRYYNAALLLAPDGSIIDWYAKQQLVPMAEHVPFWENPVIQSFFVNVIGVQGVWSPGSAYRLLAIPETSINAGTPICFEDAFGNLCRQFVRQGADVLINLTNNSWSRTDSAQIQHFVAAKFRAIESRRSLVRSTNAGYTAVVSPWGTVTEALPMFTTDNLRITVPIYQPAGPTPYLIYGDLFAHILLLIALLAIVAGSDLRNVRHRRVRSDVLGADRTSS